MADQFWFVKWKQGEIRIHASSAEQAIEKTFQFIAQPDRNLILAHPLPIIEDKDQQDAEPSTDKPERK